MILTATDDVIPVRAEEISVVLAAFTGVTNGVPDDHLALTSAVWDVDTGTGSQVRRGQDRLCLDGLSNHLISAQLALPGFVVDEVVLADVRVRHDAASSLGLRAALQRRFLARPSSTSNGHGLKSAGWYSRRRI
ncbi:hypothetical protein LV35_04218 [Acinetobacter baumannii]|uniref:Uncharacterized protein n=1 Tax=Acinetobacter baumannii TaxID=470 RepID=A0AAJ0VMB4_ACIBA|nr:hypothetical protein LV35_04218 [Acinetobacter baumannii]